MKDFWNDIMLPAITENKLSFILGSMVVLLLCVVAFSFASPHKHHTHHWTDVKLTESNISSHIQL